MKRILLVSALMLSITAASAHAEFKNVTIEIDSMNRMIDVSGEIGAAQRSEPVKLIVLKPDAEEISAQTIFAVDEKYAQEGSFSFGAKFPQNAQGGKYKVYLQSPDSGIYIDEVMYMTSGFLADMLNELDKAQTQQVQAWIKDNAEYFELDRLAAYEKYLELSESGTASVSDALAKEDFGVRDDNSDLQDKIRQLSKSFEQAVIVAVANDIDAEDVNAIKAFFVEYSEQIVIKDTINSYIEDIGEKENNKLLTSLFSEEITSLDKMIEKYRDMVIVSRIKITGHWSEVSTIFENEQDILLVDSALVQKVGKDDLYKAYHALVGKTFDSAEDAVKAFNKACGDVIDGKKNNTKPSSSGGGSGSRGSSGVGAVYTPVITQTTPKQDNNGSAEMFSDLDSVPWAKEYINELARQKVISGYGNGLFGPRDNVTRGQFARILVNAFGLVSEQSNPAEFSDVPAEHIFKDAVDTVSAMGIVYGVSENYFGVDADISREDVCTIICRAFTALGFEFEGGGLDFDDADSISEYARQNVALMCGLGIVSGDGNCFNPKNSITRAELSRIICLSINKITEGDLK